MTYKLGSLFDGIGGFPLVGKLVGMTPVWASEIEPFPIRVTEKRLPEMIQLGDVTKIDGRKISPVDVITFGSPCQSVSISGKREGMKHIEHGAEITTRSGLFYEAVRIIREMREATNGRYPAFAVFENVPGLFSSNQGEDFRCVLEELSKIGSEEVRIPRPAGGKWIGAGEIVGDDFSLAWRVLDAQYWGVPQHRRRIFLVADFAGRRAGKVLFECESLPGRSTPRGEAWEKVAPNAGGGSFGGNSSDGMTNDSVIYSLQGNIVDRPDGARCNGRGWSADGMFTLNTVDRPAIVFMAGQGMKTRGVAATEECSPMLGSEAGENSVTSIVYPTVAHTLKAESDGSPCIDGRGPNVIALNCRSFVAHREISGALQTNGGSLNYNNPIVFDCYADGDSQIAVTVSDDHEQPIMTNMTKPSRRYIVRRLTPLECGRLQGFPDGWCDDLASENPSEEEVERWQRIFAEWDAVQGKPRRRTRKRIEKWLKRPNSDSAEYKAYGNSVAVPCVFFVLAGIVWAMEQEGEGCP